MELYAPARGLRARQILADVGLLLWVLVWIQMGRTVHRLVAALAAPGRSVERAGRNLADAAGRGADAAEGVPLLGDALRRPFDAVGDGGRSLIEAGVSQQDSAANLALLLGLVVALLPIAWLVARWGPWRVGWVRDARQTRLLLEAPQGLALIALRALATRPLRDLHEAEPDPWEAFTAGRHGRLAAVELDALGLAPSRDREVS
jgi:hypothetical protein